MIDKDGERFIDTMRELREGRAANEAGQHLARLVEAVTDTHGAGTVTLTIRVAMLKDSDEYITTVDKVVAVIPEERTDTWWFGPNGELMHSRPRNKAQTALPLPGESAHDDPEAPPLPYKD